MWQFGGLRVMSDISSVASGSTVAAAVQKRRDRKAWGAVVGRVVEVRA